MASLPLTQTLLRVNDLAATTPATYRGPMDDRQTEQSGNDEQQDAPVGGDETTEEQLEADNPAEEDTLKTLDPNDSPA